MMQFKRRRIQAKSLFLAIFNILHKERMTNDKFMIIVFAFYDGKLIVLGDKVAVERAGKHSRGDATDQ